MLQENFRSKNLIRCFKLIGRTEDIISCEYAQINNIDNIININTISIKLSDVIA